VIPSGKYLPISISKFLEPTTAIFILPPH